MKNNIGEKMEIDVTTNNRTVKLIIKGNIDEQGADVLKQNFMNLNKSLIDHVVIDMKNVNHIGSAGIGKLLLFYKDFAIKGGKITVDNVSRSLYDLFKMVKLDTLMKINSV
jgi:anti-anti-sigma factor